MLEKLLIEAIHLNLHDTYKIWLKPTGIYSVSACVIW